MNCILKTLASLIAGCVIATTAGAATITNGSFEDPDIAGSFVRHDAGSTGITGWTVGSGSVDLVDSIWIAEDGDQAIDLDGLSVGSIFQHVTDLIIGVSYVIDFYMSGNDAGGPAIKTMDVTMGTTTQGYSFDTAIGGAATGVWVAESLTFTATDTAHTLTFQSTSGGTAFGPAIDHIRIAEEIAAVPVPAGLPLMFAGLAGLGFLRRRNG